MPFPPLLPVQVSNFTIPFDIADSAGTFRDVELLVSKDRGKHWYSADVKPVSSKKFAFHADSSGEYWFAFRTITAAGTVSPMTGFPQLRVLVETKSPIIVLPSQASESGPLTPPKPMRFREGMTTKQMQPANVGAADAETFVPSDEMPDDEMPENAETGQSAAKTMTATDGAMLGPKLPGFDPSAEKDSDTDLLDNLLTGMDPFLDIQPAAVKSVANTTVAAEMPNVPSQTSGSPPPGGIIGIFLSNTAAKPQIVVRWNKGTEPWQDAQIDVFRSLTKDGQRSPIAINLPNNGEYWWFLTPEDLKPFYVTVQIRSLRGGISGDRTQTAITIDPQGLLPKSASLGY